MELTDGNFKTVRQKCGADFPTKLHCVLAVKERVTALLGAAAVEAAELSAQEAAKPADADTRAASSSAGLLVFEFQKQRQQLVGVVEAARLRVERALQAEREAERKRESEQQSLAEAQAALEELLLQHPSKRVRQEAEAAGAAAEEAGRAAAEAALAAAGPPPHPRTKETPPRANPPNWDKFHGYSSSTYQKLEVEEQDRRAIKPKEGVTTPSEPPYGVDGALKNWRRGLIGAVQSFAGGSLDNVVPG